MTLNASTFLCNNPKINPNQKLLEASKIKMQSPNLKP